MLYIGSQRIGRLEIPTGASAYGIGRNISDQGVLSNSPVSFSLPEEVITIGNVALYYAFQNCSSLTSVDLSNIISVKNGGMQGAFNGCASLTSVDLSSLTTISGSGGMNYAFQNCSSLTSVDLSSLATINGSNGMSSAFRSCTSLTSLSFPALTSTSFGSYTNQFNNMLQGVTGCTVHFPSNLQSVIGSWSDVTAGFGGTNTTVLFDLPATEAASSCCVLYSTPVNYADGTTKIAENVEVGDKLLGFNENTGTFEEVEVLDITHKLRNQIVKITTKNHEIEITPDHPILTDKGWAVYDLTVGNYKNLEKVQLTETLKVLTSDKKYESIESIEYRELETPVSTYAFNVTDGIDTYVTSGLISHNHDVPIC